MFHAGATPTGLFAEDIKDKGNDLFKSAWTAVFHPSEKQFGEFGMLTLKEKEAEKRYYQRRIEREEEKRRRPRDDDF